VREERIRRLAKDRRRSTGELEKFPKRERERERGGGGREREGEREEKIVEMKGEEKIVEEIF